MNRSMSVFGQSPCATVGAATFLIGWNDQNARCSGVMMYGLSAGVAGADVFAASLLAGTVAEVGLSTVAASLLMAAEVGHGAPARTHSTSASISSGLRRPPF